MGITDGFTTDLTWAPGLHIDFPDQETKASFRLSATLSDTDSGILFETGKRSIGVVCYLYQGVVYAQGGDGISAGTTAGSVEVSWPAPAQVTSVLIEAAFDAATGMGWLAIDGQRVDLQYSTGGTLQNGKISEAGEGGVGEAHGTVAAKARHGWNSTGAGAFTGSIDGNLAIMLGQVPAPDAGTNQDPTVEQQLPPVTGTVGDPDVVRDLRQYFEDPDDPDDALTYEIDGGSASSSVSGHTLTTSRAAVVDETILVRATDPAGASISQLMTVQVEEPPDEAPTAAFTFAVDGLSVTFDASASSDPENGALTYSWAFGDGASGTGVSPTHTYVSDGTRTVTLTVTDDAGQTDQASQSVTVEKVTLYAPYPLLSLDGQPIAGVPVYRYNRAAGTVTETVTEADGHYQLPAQAGTYTCWAEVEPYAGARADEIMTTLPQIHEVS